MSAAQAYVQLHRLRSQVERSIGALLVARTGRAECRDLDAMLGDWDGALTPLIRKRVARHVEQCETCGARKRSTVSSARAAGRRAGRAAARRGCGIECSSRRTRSSRRAAFGPTARRAADHGEGRGHQRHRRRGAAAILLTVGAVLPARAVHDPPVAIRPTSTPSARRPPRRRRARSRSRWPVSIWGWMGWTPRSCSPTPVGRHLDVVIRTTVGWLGSTRSTVDPRARRVGDGRHRSRPLGIARREQRRARSSSCSRAHRRGRRDADPAPAAVRRAAHAR